MFFLKLYGKYEKYTVSSIFPVKNGKNVTKCKKTVPWKISNGAVFDISSDYARVILPERRQRVQTFTRFTSPSTSARTDWILGFQAALVWRLEWLTLLPLITPLPHTSQNCAIRFYLLHRISLTLLSKV